MHDGMQYDPIQGHEPLKVGNSAICKSCLLRHIQWDHGVLNWDTIFGQAGFVIFGLVLCHVTLKLARSSIAKSRPSGVSPVRG